MTYASRATSLLCHLYGLLLYAYPQDFRRRFGKEMRQSFRTAWMAAAAVPAVQPRLAFLGAIVKDWITSSIMERITTMKLAIRNKGLRTAVRSLAVAAGAGFVFLFAAAPFLQAYVIQSDSMEGSLKVGDHLLVNKFGPAHEVHRGEMVTFRYPENPIETFIKRVVGIPGDRIRIVGKQVILNGQPLAEPYALHSTSYMDDFRDNFPAGSPPRIVKRCLDMLQNHVVDGSVVVPPGMLFVLGDNRDDSWDSRYWGFLPRADVIGRPLLVYWSYKTKPGEERPGQLPRHFFSNTRWDRTLMRPR